MSGKEIFPESNLLEELEPASSEVEGSLCKIVSSGDPSLNPVKGWQEFFALEFTLH